MKSSVLKNDELLPFVPNQPNLGDLVKLELGQLVFKYNGEFYEVDKVLSQVDTAGRYGLRTDKSFYPAFSEIVYKLRKEVI